MVDGRQVQDEHGQGGATAVEYAILASLIAMAIFGAVAALGLGLPPIFQRVIEGF